MDKCYYCEAEPIRLSSSMAWGMVGKPTLLCEHHATMRYELRLRLWLNGDDGDWLDLAMLIEVASDTA